MFRFNHKAYPSNAAFTLVELLAATAITLILVLSVLGLTTHIMTIWNRANGKLSSNMEAQIALAFLARDLESMVLKNDGKVWLDVQYNPVNGISHQTHIMFYSSVLDRPLQRKVGSGFETIQGDVCTVQYVTRFDNPFANAQIDAVELFGLYRAVVDAENTFDVLASAPMLSNLTDINTAARHLANFWSATGSHVSRAVDEQGNYVSGPDFNHWATGPSTYLSANIIDFRMVFYYKDINHALKPLLDEHGNPSDFIYLNGVQLRQDNAYIALEQTAPGAELQYVDVSLTVLSDKGGQLFSSIAQGLETDMDLDREQVINEYGSTYSRRICLLSNPF